jgi:hypothetical protein
VHGVARNTRDTEITTLMNMADYSSKALRLSSEWIQTFLFLLNGVCRGRQHELRHWVIYLVTPLYWLGYCPVSGGVSEESQWCPGFYLRTPPPAFAPPGPLEKVSLGTFRRPRSPSGRKRLINNSQTTGWEPTCGWGHIPQD